MKTVNIGVSDATRAFFDKHSLAVRKDMEAKDEFNQDMNALATSRAMRELLGLKEWPADKNGAILELLKVAGNASAQRQRLNSEKKAPAGGKVTAETLKLA